MVRSRLPFGNTRQAEIIEVVARNGWDYFRNQLPNQLPLDTQLLDGQSPEVKPQDFKLPLPNVLKQILIELGPTFVKLGQLLSTRPDLLSPDYIQALETLQSDVPALPWSEVEPILQAELKQPVNAVFAEVEQRAIAAGSLGQVHRGRLLDGTVVAIKIQRPGIQSMIERDLEVLGAIADFFSNDGFGGAGAVGLGRAYDLRGLVEEFRTSLSGELDFRREARNTQQIGENLANSGLWPRGQVIVPQVYTQYSSQRVLVLEWIVGSKLTETTFAPARQKAVSALIVQAVMQQMFLNRFFHADPHPGNFIYIDEGDDFRLAMIDCGMVAILDPRTQRIVTDLVVGIVYEQPRQVAQAVRELGFTRLEVDIRAIESAFDRLLRRYYTRPLNEINMAELLNEALRIPRENKIQMPGTIGLLVKAIANVEGIARRLDPEFDFIAIARPVVEKSLQQRLVGAQALPELARSSLYLSQLMLDLPQRVDVLLDRLERSELGLNWRWRGQSEFQTVAATLAKRLTVAVLAVGCMVSGALLAIATTNATGSSAFSPLWSEGFLATGGLLGLWLLLEFTLRR